MHIISIKTFVATYSGDRLQAEPAESRGHDKNWPRKFWQGFKSNMALLAIKLLQNTHGNQ